MNGLELISYEELPARQLDPLVADSVYVPVRGAFSFNGRRFNSVVYASPEFMTDSVMSVKDLLMREAENWLESEGVLEPEE